MLSTARSFVVRCHIYLWLRKKSSVYIVINVKVITLSDSPCSKKRYYHIFCVNEQASRVLQVEICYSIVQLGIWRYFFSPSIFFFNSLTKTNDQTGRCCANDRHAIRIALVRFIALFRKPFCLLRKRSEIWKERLVVLFFMQKIGVSA